MDTDLAPWFWALGIFSGCLALGALFRKVFTRFLERWFGQTETPLDDIIFTSVRRHIPLWFGLAGAAIAFRTLSFAPDLQRLLDRVALGIFVISASLAMASLLSQLLQTYASRFSLSLPATTLTENLLRLIVLAMGILLLLSNLEISITPLLTALGVGSLAVALALQFVDQYLLKHEFIKRLHTRYRKEGIEIPFPHHVVQLVEKRM